MDPGSKDPDILIQGRRVAKSIPYKHAESQRAPRNLCLDTEPWYADHHPRGSNLDPLQTNIYPWSSYALTVYIIKKVLTK